MTAAGPDHRGDGDGWVECDQGHRHWGRFGAAGLLVHRPGVDGGREVLLQHRAEWSHFGGTWGLPGGARESHEDAVTAALREAAEEASVDPGAVRPHGRYDVAHGGWSYSTVLASAPEALPAAASGGESIDVAWVPAGSLTERPLHPGLADAWSLLRSALAPITLLVDAANVVGSRPDGWWRDRAGAATRLVEACARLAAAGLPDAALAGGDTRAGSVGLSHHWPDVVVVVEGAARPAAQASTHAGVSVVAAPGSGDDELVARAGRVRSASDDAGPVLVVTADRGLAERVRAVGADVAGPRWLLGLLGADGFGRP